jgi:protein SCO1
VNRSGYFVAFIVNLCTCAAVLADDEHAAHRQALGAAQAVQVTSAQYEIPDVVLHDASGQHVHLQQVLASDRAIALNFIFTSCKTICPVMTATVLQLQAELAGAAPQPEFVSISIDPDYDSAPVLKTYAERHGARWTFLTGSREDVITVLKAFGVWRGGKNNHTAVTLFRKPHQPSWLRVDGLAPARTLAQVWLSGQPDGH